MPPPDEKGDGDKKYREESEPFYNGSCSIQYMNSYYFYNC